MDNFFKFALIGIIIAFVMNLSPKQVELKPSEINQWFNIAEKYDGVKYEYGLIYTNCKKFAIQYK